MTVREALLTLLDQVDYTQGNCSPTDRVVAALPVKVIELCREALAEGASSQPLAS